MMLVKQKNPDFILENNFLLRFRNCHFLLQPLQLKFLYDMAITNKEDLPV